MNKTDIKGILCPVCGKWHFGKAFEACPVCGWINDEAQHNDPDLSGLSNKASLNEFRWGYYDGLELNGLRKDAYNDEEKTRKLYERGRLRGNMCPVCGKYFFQCGFDICPFCLWINDTFQIEYPDATGVGNADLSLNKAKELYAEGIAFNWIYDDHGNIIRYGRDFSEKSKKYKEI